MDSSNDLAIEDLWAVPILHNLKVIYVEGLVLTIHAVFDEGSEIQYRRIGRFWKWQDSDGCFDLSWIAQMSPVDITLV